MALILNIETGTDICSVLLSDGERVLAIRESEQGRAHAQNLGAYIDDLMAEAGISTSQLDAVAVAMGPGSYTGLRIGVSMAKGLCYALGIPLIAVNSLEAMCRVAAAKYPDLKSGRLCPMIDARRMEVYTQVYDLCINPLTEVEALVIDGESFETFRDSEPFYVFGNGAAKCAEVLNMSNLVLLDVKSSAMGMVVSSLEAYNKRAFQDVAYFEPYYLKEFYIASPKAK